jgi:NADP-dependent aldehyde dehydrogenase
MNPCTGKALAPDFYAASKTEVDAAAQAAGDAFEVYGQLPGQRRAKFLRTIVDRLESAGAMICQRACQETALSRKRLQSELARTCFQLRMFADWAEIGSGSGARIDHAVAGGRSDMRTCMVPVGSVAVFPPANFPLAYAIAGGDTASALAAGCSVVVKAHESHPGVSEWTADEVQAAAKECKMPTGVFSMLFDDGFENGVRLLQHPAIRAAGFTGSREGGLALARIAAERPEPIPFFGELSSQNPVFLLPQAIRRRGEEMAGQIFHSMTLCAGQYCTSPGQIILVKGKASERFISALARLVDAAPSAAMLSLRIAKRFHDGVLAWQRIKMMQLVAGGSQSSKNSAWAGPALFRTTSAAFRADSILHAQEVFGSAAIIVVAEDIEELSHLARGMAGSLTATIHADPEDLPQATDLVAELQHRAGRLIFNGVPTGLDVGPATVHGGPFPATTDARFSAVGSTSIQRWLRPVAFQNFPDALLPEQLLDKNPAKIWRHLDGVWTQA